MTIIDRPPATEPAADSDALARQLRHVKMLLAVVLVALVGVSGGAWFLSRPDPGPSQEDCFTYALRIDGGTAFPGDRERFARCFD